MLYYHSDVANLHHIVSTYTMAQGRIEDTLDRLEKMTEHALKADMAKPGDAYTSPFTNKLVYPGNGEEFDTWTVHNNAYYCRQWINSNRYDSIREEPRFKAICEKLEANMK